MATVVCKTKKYDEIDISGAFSSRRVRIRSMECRAIVKIDPTFHHFPIFAAAHLLTIGRFRMEVYWF